MDKATHENVESGKSVLQDLLAEVKSKQARIDAAANGLAGVLVELLYLRRTNIVSPDALKEIETMVLKINEDLRK